ncbi:MAG: FliI/YscN family ATPase [Planctomycetota bacterium]
MPLLAEQCDVLESAAALELRGRVTQLRGLAVRLEGMPAPLGSLVAIHSRRGRGPVVDAEIVGFDRSEAIAIPLGDVAGVSPGDRVVAQEFAPTVRVGPSLLGRVLDGRGRPIDGLGPLRDAHPRTLSRKAIDPLGRPSIDRPLGVGVRAVDTMTPLGRGQRVGVFAAPGVGKSTLLGQMAKATQADVSVIALVGERGREVRDFVDHVLGPDGLARSVVVASTGDEPAPLRVRAALVATAVAEHFRDQGLDVLLIMDSVTRYCQALRQVALAAGEPPATRGYPASVFGRLPELLERAGRTERGSITGLYSVLVEGDDMDEPVSDACRGVLDGHILLDRKLAERGHFPAIDVLGSVSRVDDEVMSVDHRRARDIVAPVVAAFRDVEDLVNVGAYAAGSNPDFDLAIAVKPAIDKLLKQGRGDSPSSFQTHAAQLAALAGHIEQARQAIAQMRLGAQPAGPTGPT